MNLSTVVYPARLVLLRAACTSRTVLGPSAHKTLRISSSASVGRGASLSLIFLIRPLMVFRPPIVYYESLRTVNENLRSAQSFLREWALGSRLTVSFQGRP